MESSERKMYTVATNVCRWLLGLVLMVSGFVKAIDPVGSMYTLQEYADAFSTGTFSDGFMTFAVMFQSALEFLFGVFLFMGIYRRFSACLAPLVMLFFTALTFLIYWEDKISDCGCFGEAFTLSNGETLLKNVFLLLLSVVVFLGRRRFVYCISSHSRWMVTIFAIFYISLAEAMSFIHLPVLDFSLYAAGNDLRRMTEVPAGEHRIVDVYEFDGELREYHEGEQPDTLGNFVESRSEFVGEPALPLINDFAILDWEEDFDVVPEILADSGYVCVIAIENVEKASVSRVDKINELYDYCLENGIPFYATTASDGEVLELWRKRTGAEYPIYWTDEAVLRRMIRANPGLVLLKNGLIVGKWNVADLPAVELYAASSTGMPDGVLTYVEKMRGLGFWIPMLIVPLLFIAVVDILACHGKNRGEKEIETNVWPHADIESRS